MERTVGVVGGGIVGLAVAREVTRRWPGVRVTVFEKESQVAVHQTGHNSGVVHAGIYYRPGSLKAELCTRGRHLLRDYCAEQRLPYDECGKVVVAVSAEEMGRFDALGRTALENGVRGLRRLSAEELAEVEPQAAGIAALHSPRTAITDYVAIAGRMVDEVESAGGRVLLSTPVSGVSRRFDKLRVASGARVYDVDRLVLCGGLQSDRLGALVADPEEPRIVPFRGEYMAVSPAKAGLVRGMIYPVPDPRYPFLGVHFTRRVDGSLEVGPNAVLSLDREGYRRAALRPADALSTLRWPGFRQLAREHWRTGLAELRGSVSLASYMEIASRYVPAIGPADVVRAGVGIRAQAVARDGSLVDDFVINASDGIVSVRNAPSPAATSSMAIAEHVVDRMDPWGVPGA